MSDSSALPKSCPECGAVLPSDATDGLCPRCLMAEALLPSQFPTGTGSAPRLPTVFTAEELAPHFPQYEILRLLGRGGMGAVYLARQTSLDRLVAIKILPADAGDEDLNFAERFKNEARAMAKLSHPGIVAVFDFGETANGLLFIVMEYIEGTDVAQMVANHTRLHSAHAMAITAHVCDALQYAHERGIIHRDIKPSNIMVRSDGVVKVADFGLAKMSHAGPATGLTQSGMAMGTPHFIAPETLMTGVVVDQRADIYAVGVMLYQMLTGKVPQGLFEMPSLQVPGLDPRYDSIVAKALREDRELRYRDASEMRHDLDAILTQPVVKVEPPEEKETPAALPPTPSRAQRPAGQPGRTSRRSAPAPKKKSSTPWVTGILGSALIIAIGAFFALKKPSVTPVEPGTSEASAATPATATKDAPFVNSLGMKFVPVPGAKVLFCIHETRYKDYAVYAGAAQGVDDSWKAQSADGFTPTEDNENHPVMKVSWEDAQKFCDWLSQKEGNLYRLPTDEEWSIAAGLSHEEQPSNGPTPGIVIKSPTKYPWGDQWPPPIGSGNFSDESRKAKAPFGPAQYLDGYDDGFPTTAPVMSFKPNQFGIYDLEGNVREWCMDWIDQGETDRVLRGSCWHDGDRVGDRAGAFLFSTTRSRHKPSTRHYHFGFRAVLVSANTPSSAAVSAQEGIQQKLAASAVPPPAATKDAPFINTLGMKFVPVPITGGPTGGKKVLFSVWETRVQDYAAFVDETKRVWPKPDFEQEPRHPATVVTWEDTQAFCAWLTERERKAGGLGTSEEYRLPTDHEWSCAAGLGGKEDPLAPPMEKAKANKSIYPWGTQWPPPVVANIAGEEVSEGVWTKPPPKGLAGYRDGYPRTSPVGSFPPDGMGLLYDLAGNVKEWCQDGPAPGEMKRILRGGAWLYSDENAPCSSSRSPFPITGQVGSNWRSGVIGFRCVIAPIASADKVTLTPSTTITATKDAPFINTLGMKFVPVPITGGPTNGRRLLFSVWETRVQDYEPFAKASKRRWDKPPFAQGPTHPAVKVSWDDARAFCELLTVAERAARRLPEGATYRLPTDHEWSCAADIGGQENAAAMPQAKHAAVKRYPWPGLYWPPPAGSGNYFGIEGKGHELWSNQVPIPGTGDDFPYTAPVGSFAPNRFGLHDLSGNAWEWCADWFDEKMDRRVLRGASFACHHTDMLLLSHRRAYEPIRNDPDDGFRVVLDMGSLGSAAAVPPAPASQIEPGYTALLESPQLSGWKEHGDGGGVEFADGVLTLKPRKNFSGCYWYARQAFGDFNLRLQFKLTQQGVNSGVMLRFDKPDEYKLHYDVDLSNDPNPLERTGAIMFVKAATTEPQKMGEWNDLEITATGQSYRVWVNGILVNEFTGDRRTNGYIGFQLGRPTVQFRNVRIKDVIR